MKEKKEKFVIVILSSEHEVGKALHGLIYGQELHEAGHEVQIYFDGQGTHWLKVFAMKDHPFHPVFKGVRETGIIKGACHFCTDFFNLTEDVEELGIPLEGNTEERHFSLSRFVKEGYSIITL